MKNIFTILAVIFFFSVSLLGNNVPGEKEMISNEEVKVVVLSEVQFLESFNFNLDTKDFKISAVEKIETIQIVNEQGIVEIQLPVNSNIVSINKNLFAQGHYKLAFVFEDNKVKYAEVTIK